MFKKLTVGASFVLFCGLFWVSCPWFAEIKDLPPVSSCSCEDCVCPAVPNNEDCSCAKCVCDNRACSCEKCVDGCTGLDGEVCDCGGGDCGCPACVGN